MGTRGLVMVRFRRRYYIRYNQWDSYYDNLGAKIVASIPANPEGYQRWLGWMRTQYAALERAIERCVHEIRDGCEPDYSQFDQFTELPSELPQLQVEGVEYTYIINLDCEILTMNYGIHWKLGNIPRHDDLWLRAIVHRPLQYKPTLSFDLCPEEHMAAPALELPEPDWGIGYPFDIVSPKTSIAEPRKAFLTLILATTLVRYEREIVKVGREWSPDSFPFRELAFALVSIASGRAGFHSFPARRCDPRDCVWDRCDLNHLFRSPGWLNQEWAGDKAPLLEFGSMSHLPGERPGVSSAETMYWMGNVLVSLALVLDGAAVMKATAWAIERGHANFQIVILNLFEAVFVEVFYTGGGPYVKVSYPVCLWPLREVYCMSTHPREQPPRQVLHYLDIMKSNNKGTRQRLQKYFPGLAALVNFFEIAANRHAATKTMGILPPELYHQIIDFVDYDTWKTCLAVSMGFRSYGLRKYRLDDRTRIVAGPFVRLHTIRKQRVLSFDFENMQTGRIFPMMQVPFEDRTEEFNWMPLVGSDRRALMLNVCVQFEPAEDVPVEADSDDQI